MKKMLIAFDGLDGSGKNTQTHLLTDYLEKSGIPMWYDNGIKVGTAWENEIAERIENCTAVIMFLSKNIFLKLM